MKVEEREELLTAYALGTLSEPDAAAVRDLVRSDPAAASELAGYHDIVDLIALSVPLRRADPALRARVLAAAHRERRAAGSRRLSLRRLLPWTAAAAVIALALGWGANLQQEMRALHRDNAALTAVVEADAKQLQALMTVDGDVSSQALRLQLESSTAELQAALAVSIAPDVRASPLHPTVAGHGAGGHFLWSADTGAGWLTAYDLPLLPLGDTYQVWLDDGESIVPAGIFVPDDSGRAELVVRPESAIRPLHILIVVGLGGELATVASPLVLEGPIAR